MDGNHESALLARLKICLAPAMERHGCLEVKLLHLVDEYCKEDGSDDIHVEAELYQAIVNQNLADVQTQLENGCSPDAFLTPTRVTPLMLCLGNATLEIFRLLLKHGAYPFGVDQGGNTLLHWAASFQNEDAIRTLLSWPRFRQNVNARNRRQQTALQKLFSYAKFDVPPVSMVKAFLAARATASGVNVTDLCKNRDQCSLRVVGLLLSAKAHPDGVAPPKPQCYEFTPLTNASHTGWLAMVNTLLHARANPNLTYDIRRDFPLHAAVSKGHVSVALTLIRAGAKVNLKNCINNIRTDDNDTPLHFAAKLQTDAMTRILLQHNANPNTYGYERNTPLTVAIEHGNYEVAKALINGRANVNDDSRFAIGTPLHRAALGRNNRIVHLLLKEKANPHAYDYQEKTPLQWVFERCGTNAAAAILWNVTHPRLDNAAKEPFIRMALEGQRFKLVQHMLSRGNLNLAPFAGYPELLEPVMKRKSVKLVSALLRAGANFSEESLFHCLRYHEAFLRQVLLHPLAFHPALWKGDVGRRLLHWGVSPNALGVNYGLPLSCAVEHGDTPFVQELLDKKAQVQAADETRDGNTALHLAVKFFHTGIASLLLHARADPNAVNNRGLSSVDLARADYNDAFLSLLLPT